MLPTRFDRYPSPVYRTERPPLFIILRACRGSSATAETCPDSSAVGLSSSRLTEIYYIIVYNNITRRHTIRRPYSEPLPWWAKNYKSSAVAEVSDRGHNRQGPKRGWRLLCPFRGGAGSPSNTMWPGPRSTSVPSGVFIHPVVWPQRTLDKNWAAGSPSNTKSPGLRPTSIPSGILMHPAVWQQ